MYLGLEQLEHGFRISFKGDPMSGVQWASKSLSHLVKGLEASGHSIAYSTQFFGWMKSVYNRPYSGSQRASLEINTRVEAFPLTTTPTRIESIMVMRLC